MKQAITLPRPSLRFPEAGWRERFEAAVASAEKTGLALEASLGPLTHRAVLAGLEASVGALPRDLRALLEVANGGRIGHLVLHTAATIQQTTPGMRARWSGLDGRESLEGVAAADLFPFGADLDGSTWAVRELKPGAAHSVVYLSEVEQPDADADPGLARSSLAASGSLDPGKPPEHRITTLGLFLECALVRAHAAALHRQAEALAGDDLDDAPWLEAARRLESEIDPGMLRTRDD